MSVTGYSVNDLTSGYLGATPEHPIKHDVILIEGMAVRIHKIIAYRFSVTDPFAPTIIGEDMLKKWCATEQGAWVMAHAIETPIWHRYADIMLDNLTYAVTAKLTEQHYTFYQLKWA